MELLFESRVEIWKVDGNLYFFQRKPQLSEPVLTGTTDVDRAGAQVCSIIHDGGCYRMWYAPVPGAWDHYLDPELVAYAESDDGITWRKPDLNLLEFRGTRKNNLCNMAMTSPSVFIDPDSPPSHRYRGTGVIDSRTRWHHPDATDAPRQGGYYTAYSADGIDWKLDSPSPRWPYADNISSFYHPGRRQGMVFMKKQPHVGGFTRRAWWTATLKNGEWSDSKQALVPDDFDDVRARSHGLISADYYNVAQQAAGQATVGFVTVFRHQHPLAPFPLQGGLVGMLGMQDVMLVYQSEEGAAWLHTPGRPDFVAHGQVPWARGGFYVGMNAIECGDEHRLYLTAAQNNHYNFGQLDVLPAFQICYASWPKWRLWGFRADPQGVLELDLGPVTSPSELLLNYETHHGGSVRVEMFSLRPLYDLTEIAGCGNDDAVPLTGDNLGEVVRWKSGTVIRPVENRRLVARLTIDRASVYAWELRPARV